MVVPHRERRFRVRAWADWSSDSLTYEDTVETEPVARAIARDRPEPLIDVVDTMHGHVIGARRAVAFPGAESRFEPKDTL